MKKKIYLVLGASSDLGIHLIRELANSGDEESLIIAHYYSSSEKLKEIKEEYPKLNIHLYSADFSDLNDVRHFISKLREEKIVPTHIVNFCANSFQYTRLSEWDSNLINRDMTIQVYSFAEILKEFVPQMAKKHYGKIVVMLTAYTIGVPPKNMSGYVTVKYALLGLIKSIASDYGEMGININGVSPAMINTKFICNIGRKIKEITAETNPKHRNLEVQDVIPTVMLLMSDEAEFICGSNINLSGKSE